MEEQVTSTNRPMRDRQLDINTQTTLIWVRQVVSSSQRHVQQEFYIGYYYDCNCAIFKVIKAQTAHVITACQKLKYSKSVFNDQSKILNSNLFGGFSNCFHNSHHHAVICGKMFLLYFELTVYVWFSRMRLAWRDKYIRPLHNNSRENYHSYTNIYCI